jgi:hypothetical protein
VQVQNSLHEKVSNTGHAFLLQTNDFYWLKLMASEIQEMLMPPALQDIRPHLRIRKNGFFKNSKVCGIFYTFFVPVKDN